MRILLHSFTFCPNVGGIETVSNSLASGFVETGHEVTLATDTPCTEKLDVSYTIVRCPDKQELDTLVQAHDVVHSNGAALTCYSAARKFGKPFSWTHATYQVQCIDGFGWHDGKPAPLSPLPSCAFHLRHLGPSALPAIARFCLRRAIAHRVDANVSVSESASRIQPLPRQRVIYNPVDLTRFQVASDDEAISNLTRSDSTFTYVGRLITEKGVAVLLHAFAQLIRETNATETLTLKIIGEGSERQKLEELAQHLGIAARIKWLGELSGSALTSEIHRAGICVLPSAWYEPMGIVAVELMAAGKPLIVTGENGLSECVGEAGAVVPMGNVESLANAMRSLSTDRQRQEQYVRDGLRRAQTFDPHKSVSDYLRLFDELLHP